MTYVGHGGYDVLADEGLLWNDDVEQLAQRDRPTVLTAMTCLANHFALPGYPGLGELLVRRDVGGAAAVWGPTGLSQNELAVSTGRELRAERLLGRRRSSRRRDRRGETRVPGGGVAPLPAR